MGEGTPIAAILHLSGPKRGRTQRLSGDALYLEPIARAGAAVVAPGRSRGASRIASLQRSGAGYTLIAEVTLLNLLPPALVLAWFAAGERASALAWFGGAFFLLGAASNGAVIAQLGYLMEVSPDDARPAYSGYFNMLVAPATLSPLVGAALAGLHPAAPFAAALAFGALTASAIVQLRAIDRGARRRMR